MITKSTITYIRSLQDKMVRHQEGVFIVEGRKCMSEFIDSEFVVVEGFFTDIYCAGKEFTFPFHVVTDSELSKITTLRSNDSGLIVVQMKPNMLPKIQDNELVLVLDTINDPGNLGTIIRVVDWYGLSHIIASQDTVDCYNSKVLMATMGSLSHISIFYTDIDGYLSEKSGNIYGAYLHGESTHTKVFSHTGGHLVIGSEAHGISPLLEKYITDRITIPKFGYAESLNAGVATAVILDRIMEHRGIRQ